jgi:transmembrane sensor
METSDRNVSLIMEEAAAWVLKWEKGGRHVDAQEFSDWLARSPEHLQEFLLGVDVHRHIRALGAQRAASGQRAVARPLLQQGLRVLRSGWGVAAALIAVLMLLGVGFQQFVHRYQPLLALTGEVRRFNLSDGSLVQLKGWSRAYAQLQGAERKVALAHGEAFFDVEHNGGQPFTVTAANAIVRAVGTQFDVNLTASMLTVTVKSGRVEVQQECDAARSVTLEAGQQAIVAGDRCELTRPLLSAAELGRRLAWAHKVFEFERTTLASAVAQLNRYNRRQLVIRDRAIGAVLYSGGVDSADIDSFVKTLRHLGISPVAPALPGGAAGDIVLVRSQCLHEGVRCTNE